MLLLQLSYLPLASSSFAFLSLTDFVFVIPKNPEAKNIPRATYSIWHKESYLTILIDQLVLLLGFIFNYRPH